MRLAIHTQHFVGVGHHMRATRLARAWQESEEGPREVLVFDGGRPFGSLDPGEAGYRVQLPPLLRAEDGLRAANADQSLPLVLAERRRILVDGIRRFGPDVFLLDSFPFSRWALHEEVFAGIRQARASNSAVRIVCSLRDVPLALQDRSLSNPRDARLEQLFEVLNAHFDAILMHGDARVTRLEDHFPWVHRLRIPVHYTGYVQQEPVSGSPLIDLPAGRPLLVVSVGGGVNGLRLIELATAAFGLLRRQQEFSASRMVVFAGAFMSAADLAAAAAFCRNHGAQLQLFSRGFSTWLQAADLSISRGGYNTAVAVLGKRTRAVMFPAANVSDQAFRVQRLAELGIVATSPEAQMDSARLARLICTTLSREPPVHDLDLEGAKRTVQLLTELAATGASPAAATGIPRTFRSVPGRSRSRVPQ